MSTPEPDYSSCITPERIELLRQFGTTTEAINVARFMSVVPTSGGGLQIEWHVNGWDVAVEVDAAGEFDNFFSQRATEVKP